VARNAPRSACEEHVPRTLDQEDNDMHLYAPVGRGRAACWRPLLAVVALAAFTCGGASAEENDPLVILKAMSDYLHNQKVIAFNFDSDVEVVTPEMQKIQFANSGQVLLSRPDKLRVSRAGGYTDVEFVFDGKTASMLGRNLNAYAQVDLPGTAAQMLDRLRQMTPLGMPGADLFAAKSVDDIVGDTYETRLIGYGVVDGTDCYHLAMRGPEVDWQLWIESGDRPIPRKYVITSKTTAGAPQYTLLVRDWKVNQTLAEDAFAFKPPADAKKVDLTALSGADEIPDGVYIVAGEHK
jgi:hypothetical protein